MKNRFDQYNYTITFSLVITALIILLNGCVSYVQVVDVESTNVIPTETSYSYEDDSVVVNYSLWSNKGVVAFAILNKTNKPIYVDWKKSSFIINGIKMDYWIDETTVNSVSYYKGYTYKAAKDLIGANGYVAQATTATREERITFIPPKALITRAKFQIFPYKEFADIENQKDTVVEHAFKKRKTKILVSDYDSSNYPLVCRNFLTFSASEDFTDEFYVDNDFKVVQVKEMKKSHFVHAKREKGSRNRDRIIRKDGKVVKFCESQAPNRFYILK